MLAKEAKKITDKKKNNVSLMAIYDEIRKEAERGNSEITLAKYRVNDFILQQLQEDGYSVQSECGDSDYECRTVGYIISWK